jgi:hypothetical protein
VAKRADVVRVETDDKMMSIQGQDGRAYRNRGGIINLPKAEADLAITAGVPGVRPYSRLYSMGFDVEEAKRRGRW